jgi:hypothetical protein
MFSLMISWIGMNDVRNMETNANKMELMLQKKYNELEIETTGEELNSCNLQH